VIAGSLDARAAVWISTHRFGPLNDLFVWVGTIDKLGAVWIALALVVSLLRRRSAPAAAGFVAVTALTTFAADSASFGVKDLTHRTRPFEAHPEIHPLYVVHSSSFPAGHAATAAAGALLLSYLAPRGVALFGALAAAIAYSRVYVGVHYPSDVFGGAIIGVMVGGIAVGLLALVQERRGLPRRIGPTLRPASRHG
jgi:undecaprenyl-diphosphatase